jgi:sugar/nucleoside kinase (ribokinase family)
VAQLEFDVASLGIIVADIIARPIEKLPEPGKVVLVEDMVLRLGGLAAATARVLAKLGAKVALIGRVGGDGFGDFLVDTLRESGVDVLGVKRDYAVSTASTIVVVSEDGERSFFCYPGASDALCEEDVDFAIVEKARILHFGGPFMTERLDGEPAARLLRRARSLGKIVSMDTAWDRKGRWLEVIEPALSSVDIIHANLEEARAVTGRDEPEEMADFFQSYGVSTVAIKMGADGCYLQGKDGAHRMAGLTVDVVDTTGAGDAFVGGFLYGVSKNWSLLECGRFANAVGALTVTTLGGSEAVESYDATVAFMRERVIT